LWDNYPFPDKYNEHNVGYVNINVVSNLTEKSMLEARNNKNQKKDAEALSSAQKDDVIFIGGSFFVVGEFLKNRMLH
jgi:folylpolyglutamate synthase/dihydropteroate synthase